MRFQANFLSLSRTFKMMSIRIFLSSKFSFLNASKWKNNQKNTITLCYFKQLRLPQLSFCLNIMIFEKLLKKVDAISIVPIISSFLLSRTLSISNKSFGPLNVRDREILLYYKVTISCKFVKDLIKQSWKDMGNEREQIR